MDAPVTWDALRIMQLDHKLRLVARNFFVFCIDWPLDWPLDAIPCMAPSPLKNLRWGGNDTLFGLLFALRLC